MYYYVRSNDSNAYSNFSQINSFEFVNGSVDVYSPSNNTVVQPGQTVSVYINETARYDWTINVTLTVTGDGVNEEYNMDNLTDGPNMSWNYNYTVPSTLSPTTLTLIARGYNGTAENFNASSNIIVTRSVGSAVGSPVITLFSTDPTYVVQNQSINASIYAALDTILSSINTSLILPNDTDLDLVHMGYAKNNLNYSYNYTVNATDIGNYTIVTLIIDANNQQATGTRSFYTATNVTMNMVTSGINISRIKDVSSKRVLLSGDAINEGLPRGKYDVEIDVLSKPNIIFENASVNESFTVSLNYSDLDESTGPSNTRTVDRFNLAGNLEFKQFNISYNYSASAGTITTASNLKFYKCTSVTNCNWVALTSAVDTDNNTATGIASNMSIFALAESVATTTTSTTVAGGGGGGATTVNKFYDLNVISPLPVNIGLNDKVIVPVKIKNNGEVALNDIRISVLSNSSEIKAYSDLERIPYLDINREVNANVAVETGNNSGSFSIMLKAESSVPATTDIAFIYINSGIGGDANKTIIVERIKFVKDLFKENPECLELNEIIAQAEETLKEGRVEKAIALTETAINACRDLVTSKGKVLRIPGKAPYTNKQLIIFFSVFGIIIIFATSIGWNIYYKKKKKQKIKKEEQKIFNKL